MTDESESRHAKLEEIAKEHVDELPGETALGNRDPQAGGEGDPKDYQGNTGVTLPQ